MPEKINHYLAQDTNKCLKLGFELLLDETTCKYYHGQHVRLSGNGVGCKGA